MVADARWWYQPQTVMPNVGGSGHPSFGQTSRAPPHSRAHNVGPGACQGRTGANHRSKRGWGLLRPPPPPRLGIGWASVRTSWVSHSTTNQPLVGCLERCASAAPTFRIHPLYRLKHLPVRLSKGVRDQYAAEGRGSSRWVRQLIVANRSMVGWSPELPKTVQYATSSKECAEGPVSSAVMREVLM